jgi:hypothetical protein
MTRIQNKSTDMQTVYLINPFFLADIFYQGMSKATVKDPGAI